MEPVPKVGLCRSERSVVHKILSPLSIPSSGIVHDNGQAEHLGAVVIVGEVRILVREVPASAFHPSDGVFPLAQPSPSRPLFLVALGDCRLARGVHLGVHP